MSEYRIFSWNGACWKCKNPTPRVIATNEGLGFSAHEPSDKLGELMGEKFAHFRKGYSRTMESDCWANWCVICDSLQGNFFVHVEEWGVEMNSQYDSIDEMIAAEGVMEHESIEDDGEEDECPKFGYNHDFNYCSCNPNYRKEGYCQKCFTALMPFKITDDWQGREYHKKCWKELVNQGIYQCDECGETCNDFLQKFCDCPEI